jgi:7-cyano-7-deazaguanine synthase
LAWAVDAGFDVYAMTFRYGQRHACEMEAARRVASRYPLRDHVIVDIDLRAFGGSALTSDVPVPKGRPIDDMSRGIPVTYVPARNTIFLSFALSCAEAEGAGNIVIGANALDYSGYPDCRPEYLRAFERLAVLATRMGVEAGRGPRLRAPLLHRTKADIIRLGAALGLDFAKTWSCYDPVPITRGGSVIEYLACGSCDSCLLRRRGFREAAIPDPTRYHESAGTSGPRSLLS